MAADEGGKALCKVAAAKDSKAECKLAAAEESKAEYQEAAAAEDSNTEFKVAPRKFTDKSSYNFTKF